MENWVQGGLNIELPTIAPFKPWVSSSETDTKMHLVSGSLYASPFVKFQVLKTNCARMAS